MTNPFIAEIEFDSVDDLMALFGTFDKYARIIENETHTQLLPKETTLRIKGTKEDVSICEAAIENLLKMIKRDEKIDDTKISYAIDLAKEGNAEAIHELMEGSVAVTNKGRQINAKTLTQKRYIDEIKKKTCVFCVGPAGTGKTYLAVAHGGKSA